MKEKKSVKKTNKEVNVNEVKEKFINTKKENYFKKLKKLFFKPKSFLEDIEKENNYQKILAMFVVVSIIYFVIGSLVGLIFNAIEISKYLIELLTGFVMAVIIAIIWPFIASGVIHLGCLIFRCKEKFFQTFKPVTYSLMIGIVYSFILLIIGLVIRLIVPFDTSMLDSITSTSSQDPTAIMEAYTGFFAQPGAKVNLIVSIIVMIISLIHQIIFLVMGISKFQKLSRKKLLGLLF